MSTPNISNMDIIDEMKKMMSDNKEYIKECIEKWNEMCDEHERMEKESENKEKKQQLAIPRKHYENALEKTKKNGVYKMKFDGDKFKTTFRMKEQTLFAYEPKFPEGREVSVYEDLMEQTVKNGKNIYSAKSLFQHKLYEMGYDGTFPLEASSFFGMSQSSSITFILTIISLFKYADKRGIRFACMNKDSIGLLVSGDENMEEATKLVKMIAMMNNNAHS